MYKIEINNRINRAVEIVYLFDAEEEQSPIFRKTTRMLKIMFQASFFVAEMLGGLYSEDLHESTFLIALGIASLVAAIKLTYFFWNQKEIRAFIKDVGVHSFADYEEFVKVNWKIANLIKFCTTLFLMTCVGSGLLAVSNLPVFSIDKKLPINIWFPLDWKNDPVAYWATYAYVLICIIVSNIAVLLNIIIWYIMLNCAIKYEILGNRFGNMFMKDKNKKSTIEKFTDEENLFLQELIGLIKTHRTNKQTIDRFKSCFGIVFFVQITTSGIAICSSVYILNFVTHDETYIQYIFNFALLLYTFFDIFMVMYIGNEIILSSDRLSYCLFESNWLEQSKSCKKNIIILTEVLNKPMELVVGKIYPLNIKTFTSIVNPAYSMFNILRNLNK